MERQLAAKRLTASDLTFFESRFRTLHVGGQKAINLNADVFVDAIYPSLPTIARGQDGRIPVDLFIHGPGLQPELNLQRKIIKFGSYKNWRLDGEFVYGPAGDESRFDVLHPGDYVILEFVGELVPTGVRAVFLSRGVADDLSLHAALTTRFETRSMIPLQAVELQTIVAEAEPASGHPVRLLLLEADLEDLARGGVRGYDSLPPDYRVTRAELARSLKRAAEVGQQGEELVNEFLERRRKDGLISEFRWTAAENAASPYDFRVIEESGLEPVFLDVKATTGDFSRRMHISLSELRTMAHAEQRYDLYRVYELREDSGKLRVLRDTRAFARGVLEILSKLPEGVDSTGVSILPDTLPFSVASDLAPPPRT